MSANNYIASVPKLLGRENYDEWTFAVENFLVIDGLQKCIDGSENDESKNAKARAKLILTIDSSLYVHIRETSSPKELWDKLKSLFDDSGFTRRISLLRNLISLRLENCESMSSYVTQLVETAQKLRNTGFNIDEEWIGSLLLAGLPEKFSPMIMAIEHSGLSITTDSIKSKLLDMEKEVDNVGSAFANKGKNGGKKFTNKKEPNIGNTRHASKSNDRDRNDIRCYNCKRTNGQAILKTNVQIGLQKKHLMHSVQFS